MVFCTAVPHSMVVQYQHLRQLCCSTLQIKTTNSVTAIKTSNVISKWWIFKTSNKYSLL